MTELYCHETERALLGLTVTTGELDGIAAARALIDSAELEPDDFHLPAHADTYRALRTLLAARQPIGPETLWEPLRASKAVQAAGGLGWLMTLEKTAIALVKEAFASYARQVRDYALRRQLVVRAKQVMADALNMGADLDGVLTRSSGAFAGLVRRTDTIRTLNTYLAEMATELDRAGEAERVIPTGIHDLDLVIGGLQPTLTVVGGLPGAGKSALFATLVQNLARRGVRVGIFSLEDEGQWLGWRLLSDNSGIDNFVLRFRRLTEAQRDRVGEAYERVWGYGNNVLVDDRPGMTAPDIVQTARHMVVNHGVQVVLVDHLGEVKSDNRRDRHDLELADALSQLRSISNVHHVPVVVAAHLNRKADEKPGQEPRLSQFKNSSSVEGMARVALGLCREPGSDTLGICVLKNTNGKAGIRVDVTFHGAAAMIRSTEPLARDFRQQRAEA